MSLCSVHLKRSFVASASVSSNTSFLVRNFYGDVEAEIWQNFMTTLKQPPQAESLWRASLFLPFKMSSMKTGKIWKLWSIQSNLPTVEHKQSAVFLARFPLYIEHPCLCLNVWFRIHGWKYSKTTQNAMMENGDSSCNLYLQLFQSNLRAGSKWGKREP